MSFLDDPPKGSELAFRIIPCLDVRAGRVVKGVRFKNLTDLGDPAESAMRYADQGADEIVFLDITAAPEKRDTDLEWVRRTARQVFIPLTVGGGVRVLDDARQLLLAGADKVATNTAAVNRPELLSEIAEHFGSQCMVLSVDAARRPDASGWEVVTHGGRTATGLDAIEWIERGVSLGAGEILLTSIDSDGMQHGYDLELLEAVTSTVRVPVIASGGVGTVEHLAEGLRAGASAVLAASIFHHGTYTVGEVKEQLAGEFPMRLAAGDGAASALAPTKKQHRKGAPHERQVTMTKMSLDPAALRYDANGLVPVVCQDRSTGAVLMVAWANQEAVAQTLDSGLACFYSRSRERLWQKGETSGNVLRVVDLRFDCDADTLLLTAEPAGPACHLGTRTCFGDEESTRLELGWLAAVVKARREAAPESSYSSRLLAAGVDRIAQKVGEEATEVIIAGLRFDASRNTAPDAASGREEFVGEAADLCYHLMVLLEALDVSPDEVAGELARRHRLPTAGSPSEDLS